MTFTNILNISIVVLCVLVVLYYLFFAKNENYNFYQVEDVEGNKGFVHNRSNNSSNVYFLLKEEIQGGESINMKEPKKIFIGGSPEKLKEKSIHSVEDNDLYYKIEV